MIRNRSCGRHAQCSLHWWTCSLDFLPADDICVGSQRAVASDLSRSWIWKAPHALVFQSGLLPRGQWSWPGVRDLCCSGGWERTCQSRVRIILHCPRETSNYRRPAPSLACSCKVESVWCGFVLQWSCDHPCTIRSQASLLDYWKALRLLLPTSGILYRGCCQMLDLHCYRVILRRHTPDTFYRCTRRHLVIMVEGREHSSQILQHGLLLFLSIDLIASNLI